MTIVANTCINLSICMAAIFVVTFILLGFDLTSAAVALVVISMILIDIMGMMWMWNIDLNALSLVNLVMVSSLNSSCWPQNIFQAQLSGA